jgi:hypothetical protein
VIRRRYLTARHRVNAPAAVCGPVAPLLILFLMLQTLVVEGVALSGLKG